MPYYQDANLAATVIVGPSLFEDRCNLISYQDRTLGLCDEKILTQRDKDEIAVEIVGTLASQFKRFQKYLIDPFELSIKKLPLTIDIRTGCNNSLVSYFVATDSPKIRLCSLNIASDLRHQATHWFMGILFGNFPVYQVISEGCASYFSDGVCTPETKIYAHLMNSHIPKIENLLLPNPPPLSNNSYDITNYQLIGSLLCASLHQKAKKEDFLRLLAEKEHLDIFKKFQQLLDITITFQQSYQTDFEDFVRNLDSFCYKYPEGIYPRANTTGAVVTRMTRHASQLSPQPNSLTTHLTMHGLFGSINGLTYFLLEKTAKKLQKNYPVLEKSIYYLVQPILSSAIYLIQIENLENNAIPFGLNCVSGVAFQFILTYIQRIAGERNSINTLLNTLFFLHTMVVVFNSDNPAKIAIEQLLASVSAMLTYLLASLMTSRCTKLIHVQQSSKYNPLIFFKIQKALPLHDLPASLPLNDQSHHHHAGFP